MEVSIPHTHRPLGVPFSGNHADDVWQLASGLVELEVDLGRQESTVRSKSKPSSKEQKLSAAIVDSMTQERFLITELGGILPQKFVRADAMLHFHADLAAKKKDVDKALLPFRNSETATPGPRLLALQQELEIMQTEWKGKTQKACKVGEKIFKLR